MRVKGFTPGGKFVRIVGLFRPAHQRQSQTMIPSMTKDPLTMPRVAPVSQSIVRLARLVGQTRCCAISGLSAG
jgi:hypothetical protein